MWEKFMEVINHSYFGNSLKTYILSILIIIIGLIVVSIINKVFVSFLKKKASETKTSVDDFLMSGVEKSLLPIMYLGVFYAAFNNLSLGTKIDKYVDIIGIIFLTIFAIRFIARLINYAITSYWLMREKDESKIKNIKGVMIIVKAIIWGLGIVVLLDNLGFKISSLLAGLGIGGIAVALAAQAVLKDLFSYVSIIFDKPFEVGDFIIIDSFMGTVKTIGIKTTRLTSLSGEELVISNSDLTDSRVKNYKRMDTRRVVFSVGVEYGTPKEKLEKIPVIIKEIVDELELAVFDRCHFASYGDFSLNFETVYYVQDRDYNIYMNVQQDINFKIYEAFEKEGLVFAFPTQTLHIEKDKQS